MGDGFEVLIWLAVMGFIGIRSAMARSRSQAASRAESEPAPELPAPTRQPRPTARQRPRSTEESARVPARRGSGVLSRWAEFAANLERQMQEQQQAARAAAEEREGETVVVPGRRVVPRRSEAPAVADPRHESHWKDWETEPESHSLAGGRSGRRHTPGPVRVPTTGNAASESGRSRRSGLARLESYGTLKRSIILADVLGPPPGLDGISPSERRLERY